MNVDQMNFVINFVFYEAHERTHHTNMHKHAHASKKHKPTLYIAFKTDYCLSATDGRAPAEWFFWHKFYYLAVEATQSLVYQTSLRLQFVL
jgi:hypothetical protein